MVWIDFVNSTHKVLKYGQTISYQKIYIYKICCNQSYHEFEVVVIKPVPHRKTMVWINFVNSTHKVLKYGQIRDIQNLSLTKIYINVCTLKIKCLKIMSKKYWKISQYFKV